MSFTISNRFALVMKTGMHFSLQQTNFNLKRLQYGVCSSLHTKNLFHTNNRQNSATNPKFIPIKENLFKRSWNAIKYQLIGKSRLRVIGYFIYEEIADKIDYMIFFKEMNMPDTFNSWFLITELHVWMMMVKAMEMGEDGRQIRNFIVEAMWQDVSMKGKKLGVEHMSAANEQVMILGDQFHASIVAYDEGLLSDDKVLAGALWRRFFSRNCDDPEQIESMVKYIRQQMHYLDKLSEDDFRSRKIKWANYVPIK